MSKSPDGPGIAVYYSPLALEHRTGSGVFEVEASPLLAVAEPHPEGAARIENMRSVLERGPLRECCDWFEAPAASLEQLLRVHTEPYIESLRGIAEHDVRRLTGSTVFGPGSWPTILAAAGQAVAAVDHVWSGRGPVAYALVRPPGHHAQPAVADGYCFVNNIAVALEQARAKGLRRAAVIDWDVHHGNGTQACFYSDPDVLTVSLHMDHGAWGPTHRQTGKADEAGAAEGLGANLNVALPFGGGDALYGEAFERLVAPVVSAFAPELVVVACGQDANQFDPNGRQCLSMAGFHALGRAARVLAEACCDGRIALIQEGGYAVSYAALCLNATLEGILGREMGIDDPIAYLPEDTRQARRIVDALARAWTSACEHSTAQWMRRVGV